MIRSELAAWDIWRIESWACLSKYYYFWMFGYPKWQTSNFLLWKVWNTRTYWYFLCFSGLRLKKLDKKSERALMFSYRKVISKINWVSCASSMTSKSSKFCIWRVWHYLVALLGRIWNCRLFSTGLNGGVMMSMSISSFNPEVLSCFFDTTDFLRLHALVQSWWLVMIQQALIVVALWS